MRQAVAEAVVLGCGTSHGVPVVGCDCSVCRSSNPKNSRYRSSILISGSGGNLLVDAPPELRLALIRERTLSVDAVLLTHAHADHIMGLDDLRRFSDLTGEPIPVFGQPDVLGDVQRIFRYAFAPPQHLGGGIPRFTLIEAQSSQQICGLQVLTFPVLHGSLEVLGLRIGDFAYLTDVSHVPDSSLGKLKGLKTLFLDATRIAPHPSHLHLDASLELAAALGAEVTYLTHLSHDFEYETTSGALPRGVRLSFDGLRVSIY